jgi:hypothetical protein
MTWSFATTVSIASTTYESPAGTIESAVSGP